MLIDVSFVRVAMSAEAEVSLMVPQTFLAPGTGTLGLEKQGASCKVHQHRISSYLVLQYLV